MSGFMGMPLLGSLYGLRLIKNASMVIDSGERSWRRVRSPGRARRRLKRGFRQNIDVVWVPDPNLIRFADTIVAHPAIIQKLIAAMQVSK